MVSLKIPPNYRKVHFTATDTINTRPTELPHEIPSCVKRQRWTVRLRPGSLTFGRLTSERWTLVLTWKNKHSHKLL